MWRTNPRKRLIDNTRKAIAKHVLPSYHMYKVPMLPACFLRRRGLFGWPRHVRFSNGYYAEGLICLYEKWRLRVTPYVWIQTDIMMNEGFLLDLRDSYQQRSRMT